MNPTVIKQPEMIETEQVNGWNHGASALLHGQPVARDISQSTATKKANGIAALTTTNGVHYLGIAQATGGRGSNIGADKGAVVVRRGLCDARVRVAANQGVAVGDFLVAVPGQAYLSPMAYVATADGADRSNWNGYTPVAVAREAITATAAAQTADVLVEAVAPGDVKIIAFRDVLSALTADVPTTPASNFKWLGTLPEYAQFVGANLFARVSGVDATDPLKFVLQAAKCARGAALTAAVTLFSTAPQVGGDAAGEDPANGFSATFDYDADDGVQGVLNSANVHFAPGDRIGYSLDLTATTPDTAIADVCVELFLVAYGR